MNYNYYKYNMSNKFDVYSDLNELEPFKLNRVPSELQLDLTPPKIQVPAAPKSFRKTKSDYSRSTAFDINC